MSDYLKSRLPVILSVLFILPLVACAAEQAPEAEPKRFTGTVVAVKDGDSLLVKTDSQEIEIRLQGIDCPELAQAFGQKAKEATTQLADRKTVAVQPIGKDKYGRTLAIVLLPDGRNLNHELVRLGYAWWYRKYSDDQTLANLEAEARKDKRGLWADAKPTPPWDWRKEQRRKGREPKLKVEVVPNGVEIVALLPNPKGRDQGSEQLMISNRNEDPVDLENWTLRDRAGNSYPLVGVVAGKGKLQVRMVEPTMPLNNDGDEILLIDRNGVVRSRVAYRGYDVRSGRWIELGQHGKESDATPEPTIDRRLDNLDNDAVAILRQLPGVVQVTRHGPEGRPSHRIIHLLDWHFVPKDLYAADLRSQSDEPISDQEVDRAWEEHLSEVSAVQKEQMLFLDRLVQQHGVSRLHIEGLTGRDVSIFQAKVAVLRKLKAELADLRGLLDEADTSKEQLGALERQFDSDLFQIGSAGRLLMDGKIEAVLPLEDARAYEAANPVSRNGTVVLDHNKIEARQTAQAKRLLDEGEFALVVLGGAHDLSDNLGRLSGGKAEYIRVATKRWQEFAGNEGKER